MLYQLKNKVSFKCGFKIKNRGDCVRLANLIHLETGTEISYNTLRRFYGIVSGTTPANHTLDTLSKYIGYSSYINFCAEFPVKKNWDIHQKIYNSIVVHPEYALEKMENEFLIPEEYLELLITLIGGLTVTKNLETLKAVFNSNLLNDKRYSYSELLYLANCVGPMFRQVNTPLVELADTKYFTSTIIECFVDISSLNGNYGDYIRKLDSRALNEPQLLFSKCLMVLHSYLNKLPLNSIKTSLSIREIHPILYGRFMGVSILNHKKLDKEEFTLAFIGQIAKKKNKIDYLYEFLFACILAQEINLLEFVKETTAHYKISKPYYQEYHYSLFELRDAIVKLNSGVNISEELLRLKENTLFRNSHREIIDLFISILDYHNSKRSPAKLKIYLSLAKQLNYPLFDVSYCKNYFKK